MRRWLCLLLVAFVLGVLCLPPALPVIALSQYGAGAYAGADPIGGGAGYSDIYTFGDYTVTTRSQLLSALSVADPGEVIFIPGTTTITMDGGDHDLILPAGVILASDRGDSGSLGGRILAGHLGTAEHYYQFMYCEAGSRVTGLRLEGPDSLFNRSASSPTEVWIGLWLLGIGARVDNCEVYNFSEAGIEVGQDADATIEYCNIHNCARDGFGYGIMVNLGTAFINCNLFDYCRHAVAGSRGYPDKTKRASYELIYNIFGPHCTINNVIDCHGGSDGPDDGFTQGPMQDVAAGDVLLIHYNTQQSVGPNTRSVTIRGIPNTSCTVEYNWFYEDNEAEAVKQWLDDSWGLLPYQNMTVSNNWYGATAPPDDPANPPPGPAYTVLSLPVLEDNITDNSAILRGSITGPFDNQTAQGEGFVWDTVSRLDPGNVAPSASAYVNKWSDNVTYADNSTITHAITGLANNTKYYVRFAVDWQPPGDWEYGDEIEFDTIDCDIPTLQPPAYFVATSLTGTEAMLTWTNPNPASYLTACGGGVLWPTLKTSIRMKTSGYPTDPPNVNDTLVYEAPAGAEGGHSYAVSGLTQGKTYYFRIWFYDDDEGYTTYDQDFCTMYAGGENAPDVGTPDNWFSDPTCDSWEFVPGAMVIINGIENKMGFPDNYLCLVINLFLLSCAMAASYGVISGTRLQGTQTILVPFIVLCAGFLIGPVIGAFPGFFLVIGAVMGIGVAFAWARA